MAHYLDPKNDLVFKRIFGEHPHLLISFLNALMPLSAGQEIISIEYLPSELVPDNPAKRDSIVDVRCIDNFSRQFIVEMQMYWSPAFGGRMLFNASKAFSRQIEKGDDYKLLQPVYGLGIINDVFDRETDKYYHHYQIVNRENTDEIIKGLEFVILELPKFVPQTIMEKQMTALWLRFLKEIKTHTSDIPEELMANKDICEALQICEVSGFTEDELAAYERYWDAVSREKSYLSASREEGFEKGLAYGEVEREKLQSQIVEERNKLLKTAAILLQKGFSVQEVADITGLSVEQINAINI